MPKTLQAAADELDMDIKKLRRWLEVEHVEPVRDPLDRRRKLLSDSQLARLKEQQGAAAPAVRGRAAEAGAEWAAPVVGVPPAVATLESRMHNLETSLAGAFAWLASLNKGYGDLVEQVSELSEQVRQLREAAKSPAGSRG